MTNRGGRGGRPTRREVTAGLGLATFATWIGTARAQVAAASDWSVTEHARVRLIDAGPMHDGAERLAAIQVELDPGYLTYWRSPGEAGLPPTVSFDGSTGLKSVTLQFPAPGRYSEGGTEAIGYKDGVVFPVLVLPKDAATPVTLAISMDFGICERLCLPAKAAARLLLAGDGTAPEAALAREALRQVPKVVKPGQTGALSIVSVEGQAGDPTVTVRARADGSDVPALFAEAAEPWFAQAREGLWTSDGTLTYQIVVSGKPADPAPLPLRLTLVGTGEAIEVPVTLDAPPPKP